MGVWGELLIYGNHGSELAAEFWACLAKGGGMGWTLIFQGQDRYLALAELSI
jgi:hypothetical protein